jgi:hypothetical protein
MMATSGDFGDALGMVERLAGHHAADHVHVLLDHAVVGIQLDFRDLHFLPVSLPPP